MTRGLAALAVVFGYALFAGCYDWTVRSGAELDASVSRDGDAPKDGEPGDEAGGSDAEAGPKPDADCVALQNAIDKTVIDARKCNFGPGQCTQSVIDECGCKMFVAIPDSGQTKAYVDALENFSAGGCVKSECPIPCPPPVGGCVSYDGGSRFLCYEH